MDRRKTAIVTGGSRGIGRAICVKLAQKGMNVIFNYNSGEEAAKETISQCEGLGVEVHAIKADVSSSETCAAFVAEALKISGGYLDVLVNNAGIALSQGLFTDFKEDDVEKIISAWENN